MRSSDLFNRLTASRIGMARTRRSHAKSYKWTAFDAEPRLKHDQYSSCSTPKVAAALIGATGVIGCGYAAGALLCQTQHCEAGLALLTEELSPSPALPSPPRQALAQKMLAKSTPSATAKAASEGCQGCSRLVDVRCAGYHRALMFHHSLVDCMLPHYEALIEQLEEGAAHGGTTCILSDSDVMSPFLSALLPAGRANMKWRLLGSRSAQAPLNVSVTPGCDMLPLAPVRRLQPAGLSKDYVCHGEKMPSGTRCLSTTRPGSLATALQASQLPPPALHKRLQHPRHIGFNTQDTHRSQADVRAFAALSATSSPVAATALQTLVLIARKPSLWSATTGSQNPWPATQKPEAQNTTRSDQVGNAQRLGATCLDGRVSTGAARRAGNCARRNGGGGEQPSTPGSATH